MARTSRRVQALALLALAVAPLAHAATTLTDLPTLSTATTDATTTDATTTDATTSATTDATTTTSASFVASSGTGTTTSVAGLTDLPTIAGAAIPTLVVPYTADAPFMQKSSLPEGTVFIAVGAVLAFLGACVLLWRVLVAWSINRSVKKAALASIRSGSEKQSTWGGSSGYHPVSGKGSLYKDLGSSLSLDALTSSGKPVKPHFRDHEVRHESTPPQGLFFSPTAQASPGAHVNRTSSYLPAGYYASPSAQAAGGAGATTIGGSLAPYARHSTIAPSPPESPGLPPTGNSSRGSAAYRGTSRDALRAPSRDGYGSSRNSYLDGTPRGPSPAGLYERPSSSSLMVGLGGSGGRQSPANDLGGSRAPSAYLEDLFENHGNGPRERF